MSVVFEAPVPPTTPRVEPEGTTRSMPRSASSSASSEYLKDTPSKRTSPLATSRAPPSGEVSDAEWVSTSAMRFADSAAMVVMTKMKASMSMAVRIWMP